MRGTIASLAVVGLAAAAPKPSPVVAERASSTSQAPITNQDQLTKAINGFIADGQDLAMGGQELAGIFNAIVPVASPTSIPDMLTKLGQTYPGNFTNLFQSGGEIFLNSFSPADFAQIAAGESIDNSYSNFQNPPVAGIYPKKGANDAPYDLSESQLRNAIYFPPGFTYGKVRPLIMIPGTGVYAGQNFAPNAGKLFAGSSYADPVYLNIPGAQLNDIQTNAEYVAYAINYINALTHSNVSLYTWSAGSISSRWATKYWPSTVKSITNAVAISPDYHGTTLAYLLDPQYPRFPTAPAVVQQEYNATFIATLRNNGGASPRVPLTNIFTEFDEIVEPQGSTGKTMASGYSADDYNVGVTNILLQETCTVALPAGSIYNDHESILFNPVAIAAAMDALKSGKNANVNNINTTAQCAKFAADGISFEDILATEATIPIAGLNIASYPMPVGPEPTIKAYAKKDIPAGYCDGC